MFHHSSSRCLSGVFLGVLAMVSLQGCRRTEMVSTMELPSPASAVYVEDSVLTSRVRAALTLSPVQRSINIHIESRQGVVLLSGTVADKTQMDLAVFVAQTVPGVSRVDSLMLSAGTEPTTADLSSYAPGLDELRARGLLQNSRRIGSVSLVAPLHGVTLRLAVAHGRGASPLRHPRAMGSRQGQGRHLAGQADWGRGPAGCRCIGSMQDELIFCKKKCHPARGSLFLPIDGSSTWARTRDLRINSPALYRLSYRGMIGM